VWCGRETSTPNRHKSTITGAVPWFMAVVYHGVEVSLSLRSYFYSVQSRIHGFAHTTHSIKILYQFLHTCALRFTPCGNGVILPGAPGGHTHKYIPSGCNPTSMIFIIIGYCSCHFSHTNINPWNDNLI